MFMQSSGGLTDARRFQGKDSILSGPAGGIVGVVRTSPARRFRSHHRVRHGRHVHRRVALRRRARARVRDPGRRRADARADDGDPHRRRGRRVDPAFRRGALSRRAGLGGRRTPGPACYRRGGPLAVTDANVMLGKIQPGVLPGRVRAAGRPAARCRGGHARGSARSPPRSDRATGDAPNARAGCRRLRRDRGRQHGERDQEDLGAARLRRHRVHAAPRSAAPAASTRAWSPTRSG